MATIITKNSQTASAVPSAASLSVGELAVNTADGKLYTEHTGGVVKEIIPSTVVDGGITTAKIADGAITSAKIADGTIATADIANSAVTVAKISATGTPSASTFLRGDGVWGAAGSSTDVQTFTSSGTWTKPSTGTMCAVLILGGGGGGGRATGGYVGGGNGGMVAAAIYRLSDLPATVSITVGSGGSGAPNFTTPGGNGGTTRFGAQLVSYGGNGGSSFNTDTVYDAVNPTNATSVLDSNAFLVVGPGQRYTNNFQMQSGAYINQGGGNGGTGSGYSTAGIQGLFGTGGSGSAGGAGSAGTGNGSGGGSGNSSAGAGTAGLCRVVVW